MKWPFLTLSDDLIVENIEHNRQVKASEEAFYKKYFYLISDAQVKHKLDHEQASIAYSDAILSVLANIRSGKFEAKSTLKTYLTRIFFNKCVDVLRLGTTKALYNSVSDEVMLNMPTQETGILETIFKNENYTELKANLNLVGDKCKILLQKWASGFSDSEIADEMGYNTAGVVQTTRLRCLQKLKEIYKNKWKISN